MEYIGPTVQEPANPRFLTMVSVTTATTRVIYTMIVNCYRGVGTGPAGPATAGPKFPEPTIKK